jgi:hypothetical protein
MNYLAILSLFVCVATATSAVIPLRDSLPELHVIKEASFRYPYSCQPSPAGYENSALFITDYGHSMNSPDLLYNGACGGDNTFDVMLAGDNFGMLSDLGDVPLENVTASKAFNYDNVVDRDNQFTNSIKVVNGHTYATLLAKRSIRALFVFRVQSYEPSGPASIRYAVKQYGIIQSTDEAPGFSWEEPNH